MTAPDTSQNQLSSDVIARPQSVAVTAEAGRPVPADAGDAADSISLTHILLTCSGHFPLRASAPVYCSLLARAAPCLAAPHRTAPYRVGISTNETYLSTVEHAQTFRHDVQRYRYYRSEDMK